MYVKKGRVILKKNEFTFMDILSMILRHWLIIGIVVVVFAAAAFINTHYFSTPMYSADGTLYISNVNKSDTPVYQNQTSEVTLTELMTSQELLKSYVEVLNTDRFFSRVKSVSGLRYSVASLKSMVSMDSLNKTEILKIKAVAADPKVAFVLVQTIISLAPDEIEWVFEGGSLKTLDYPAYSSTPLPNNTTRNTVLAGVVGFILAFALVFIIEISDKRIKSHEDIATRYDYYILGEIPSFKPVNS